MKEIEKWKIVLAAIVIVIGVPLFFQYVIVGNEIPSNASNDGWISFFGSYLGGIIGGAATLMGVVYTIKRTKEESDKEREREKRNIYTKSALTIFYDFGFAFDNIKQYLCKVDSSDMSSVHAIKNVSTIYQQFDKHIDCFTQFHLQDNWISIIAELSGASVDDSTTISTTDLYHLYRIYGNLVTIQTWLNNDTPTNCEKAVSVMIEMQNKGELDLENCPHYVKILHLVKTTNNTEEV